MKILRLVGFGIALYVVTFGIIFIPSFYFIKGYLQKKDNEHTTLIVEHFMTKLEPALLDNNYGAIKNHIEDFVQSNIVDTLALRYTDYVVSTDTLLRNSNNIKSKDWVLNDITIDYRFGKISKLTDKFYRFEPSTSYKLSSPLEVKFQALNDNAMENSISKISFLLPKATIPKAPTSQSVVDTYLTKLLDINSTTITKSFFVNTTHEYAKLTCATNNRVLVEEFKEILVAIWKYFSITYGFFLLVVVGFFTFFTTRLYRKPLQAIELYLDDIANNNFHKFKNKEDFKIKELQNIATKITVLTKTISSLKNELTYNRNTIEQKISTDGLTKLPNRKIFELDMKTLFLENSKSYISKIKLEILKTFAKNNSDTKIDTLIVDFVETLQGLFKNDPFKNTKLYRLYGSEFVMITENTDYDGILHLFGVIVDRLKPLEAKYELGAHLFYGVSLPFDRYGTIEKTLTDLENFYTTSLENNQSYFTIEESQKLDETAQRLEKIVTSIIENDAFSLSYKFDTFLFSDPATLIMQEVAPNLIDTDGKPIPIATFISVAEHLRLAIAFDKQLIIKTLKYIKQRGIEHYLAINISISSLNDKSFNTWLESQLLFYEKEVVSKIIFSVTTFAVKNNYEQFSHFINDIKKFNGKILLKRFSYNDLTLAQLEHLDLDYIRVHKDYTTNIDTDRGVLLKNIASFAEIHDIHLLGDMVSSDSDYETLKKLHFYATCR